MAVPNLLRKTRDLALNGPTDGHVISPAAGGFLRFLRTLKQTFHEVVAAIFSVLAFAWLQSAIRAWTRGVSRWLIGAALGVAGVFFVFAPAFFLRAGGG